MLAARRMMINRHAVTAPVFDAAATATSGGGFTSVLNLSHTIGTGPNRILVLAAALFAGSASESASFGSGSFNMTLLNRVFTPAGSVSIEIWYYINPPSGAQTIQFQTSSSVRMSAISASYAHVDQTTPFGTSANTSSNGATSDSTTVSAALTDLVLSAMFTLDTGTITLGSGQSSRGDVLSSPMQEVFTDQPGGSSVTSSFSWASSQPTAQFSVPLHGA